MTTVGYGDISGTNTGERIICIFLMIAGVLFFTYTSGIITNIITNEEEENKKFQEKKTHLNNLYKKHGKNMKTDLYLQLLHNIKFSSNNDLEEFNDFMLSLFSSNEVYLIEQKSSVDYAARPVVISDTQFLYKTSVNDKLASYSLKVTYSNDELQG